ncbi:MAG: hypothetical protein R3C20_17240 [Planctomycetaceae bacterium]
MNLPDGLRDSLPADEFAAVLRWWNSLTAAQQCDVSAIADVEPDGFLPLPTTEETDTDDELYPFYEYLTNHELRVVNFVADEQAQSAHRIVSSYIASLGADYRHGQSGTVR